MLVEDPGGPTGDLGQYYWSYGADANRGSPTSLLAAPEACAPASRLDAYNFAPGTWFDETQNVETYDDYGPATLGSDTLSPQSHSSRSYDLDVYDPDAYDADSYGAEIFDPDVAYADQDDAYYDDWSWTDQPYPTYLTDRFRLLINRAELLPTRWMARYASLTIQFGLGLIFAWFGALKFVPGLSPAEGLVRATAAELLAPISFTGLQPTLFLLLLAAWEVLIGIGFLLDIRRRVVVWMVLLHMVGTALPLVLLPEIVWTRFPYALSLEGQYIIKNLVLIGGAMAVGATRRPTGAQDRG